jgi:hypothetical protein
MIGVSPRAFGAAPKPTRSVEQKRELRASSFEIRPQTS